MKQRFSLTNWLGSDLRAGRLPDIGMREMDALEALWEHGPLTAQGALTQMKAADISLSTVQSTLERLTRKQLVSREKAGRAYVYKASISKETIISRLMREISDSLAGGEMAPMVSGFLNFLDASGEDASDALRTQTRKHDGQKSRD